jgi:predicted RecA/RadA family phage recombinase
MTNFVQEGKALTLTAGGTITAGQTVKIGQVIGIATHDAGSGDPVTLMVEGVFDVTKVGSQAWTEGALVYFNGTAWTTSSAGNPTLGGVAAAAVGSGSGETTGRVRLNGSFRAAEA